MNRIIATTYGNYNTFRTRPVFQYNEGEQLLVLSGVDLPSSYRVDFSNYIDRQTSISVLGNSDGAVIPSSLLATGLPVFAFYVDVDADDTVTTTYRVEIPVIKRPKPTDIEPTPEEQSLIDRMMALMAAAIEAVEQAGLSAVGASENHVPTADGDGGWEWAAQQGGGGSSVSPYTSNPAALGTASPGSSADYSRGDHVHPKPSAADIGAIALPNSPATGAFLVWSGSAWVAQTLSTWQGGNY